MAKNNDYIENNDYIVRAISEDGTIRAFAAITTNLTREAQKIHHTLPVATAALGRTLTAASMMGCMLKNKTDTLTIQFKGDGPLGGIVAVADYEANVKGYVYNPQIDIPLRDDGKLNVGGALGKNGYVNVIKDLGLKEPYSGQVPLVSGEIAEDLTLYFARSEQIPTAMGLGVLVDVDCSVKASGGFIVQLMPDAGEDTAIKVENAVSNLPNISSMVADGMSGKDILTSILKDFTLQFSDNINTKYKCECCKERVERALISLGTKEIEDMIKEQGDIDVNCHFCDKTYHFNENDLKGLLNTIRNK